MPSWMKFAGLWGLAVVAALTLSWVAVSQVRDRVIQPATVIPTTIVALETEETGSPDPTVVVVEPETQEQLDPTAATLTASTPERTSSTSTTRATSAGPGTSSTTSARSSSTTVSPTTTSTPAAAPTTSTTLPAPTTTTTAPASNLVASTHPTQGGTVTINSGSGEVHFVSAIPQAGFTTELRETGPEKVRVRFVSASVTYEFEAEWEDGELEVETSEHTP